MNIATPIPTLTLSTELLKEWADNKAEAQQEIARAQAVIEAMTKKLDAARIVFGDDAINSIVQEAEELAVEAPLSVAAVVSQTLSRSRVGLTTPELMAEALKTPVAEKIRRVPNNLYNAVYTLVNRGDAVRVGKLVYSNETFERVSSGEWDDPRFSTGGAATLPLEGKILEILKGFGRGAKAGDLLVELLKDPEVEAKNRENPKYLHAFLSKLVHQGKLVRNDRFYMLPDWVPPSEPSIFDKMEKN